MNNIRHVIKFIEGVQAKGKFTIKRYDNAIDSVSSSSSLSSAENGSSDFENDMIVSSTSEAKFDQKTISSKEIEHSERQRSSRTSSLKRKPIGTNISKWIEIDDKVNVAKADKAASKDVKTKGKESIIFYLMKKFLEPINYNDLAIEKQKSRCLESSKYQDSAETPNSYFMSSIAFSISLGNLWRFPLKCIEGGGASFLIIYFLLLCLVVLPIFIYEMALGQFAGRGLIGAYTFCPASKGVGISNLLICFVMGTCNGALLSWSMLYSAYSLYSAPWSKCDQKFNFQPCFIFANSTNISTFIYTSHQDRLASYQFFYKVIIGLELNDTESTSGNNVNPQWYNVICSFVAWILICLTLVMDFEASNKVKYITISLPFIVLYVILILTATLPRARKGLELLLFPNWGYLSRPRTWAVAAEQALYTLTISGGIRICTSSTKTYKFYSNFYKESWAIFGGHILVSILSAIIVFQMIGYYMPETSISDLPSDPALVFRIMSESANQFGLYFGNFFTFLFSMTFVIVGLNTQSGLVRCVITYFISEFPKIFKNSISCKFVLILGICFLSFCLGIPFLIPEGYVLFLCIDFIVLGQAIIMCAIAKIILVFYFYGWKKLCEDIFIMTEYRVNMFWIFSWTVTCPSSLILIILLLVTKETFYFRAELNEMKIKEITNILWIHPVVFIVRLLLTGVIIVVPCILLIRRCIQRRQWGILDNLKWLFRETILWGPIKKNNWLISRRYRDKMKKLDIAFK